MPSPTPHHADRHLIAAEMSPHASYPVSADETWREYGRDHRHDMRPLWRSPGVMPKHPTEGIRIGAEIVTYAGRGTVTRVGTIAGWYMLNGQEQRWEISQVRRIIPAPCVAA